MASMTRLRRRLLRWRRYGDKIRWQLGDDARRQLTGSDRATIAYVHERWRRQVRTVYWPTGQAS